jgi:hypothetical protein
MGEFIDKNISIKLDERLNSELENVMIVRDEKCLILSDFSF